MQRKEIEKQYIKKINELKKHDEAYFQHDSPIISDKNYDDIKAEILIPSEYIGVPTIFEIRRTIPIIKPKCLK